MTTNYDLRRGGENYYGDWKDINKRIDSSLRSIYDFHWEGPRNWFGPSKEGSWSTPIEGIDRTLHWFFGIVVLIVCFMVMTAYVETDIGTVVKALIYFLMFFFAATLWALQDIKPNIPMEYFSAGKLKDMPKYLKISVALAVIWIAFYVGASQIPTYQSVVVFPQELLLLLMLLLVGPFCEAVFNVGTFLPSVIKNFGILPGIIISVIFRVFLHITIFPMGLPIIFTALYGLIVYPVATAYRTKEIGIWTHVFVNSLLYILGLTLLGG